MSFGLVSVPVKLYAATESHDVSFRQVHAKDGGRIKYQRVCSLDGEEVAYADIAKGYETEDGEMVILTDDDMAELPSTSSREISVEKFVPSEQIDPIMFDRSYFLEPEKSAVKAYALLRRTLEETDRTAIVHLNIGKTSFDEQQLLENYAAVIEELIRAKPSAAKGRYLRTVTIASTMGPGIKVDPSRTRDILGLENAETAASAA